MYHIGTISDILRQRVDFGSVVRALDFYSGGPGSNHVKDAGFFSSYASFLSYEFSYS